MGAGMCPLLASIVVAALVWTWGLSVEPAPRVVVDVARSSPGPLHHFWTSTGLCPPAPHTEAHKTLLSADHLLNLVLIGALPQRAISHVRIHWLLDLVSISPAPVARYNWTHLDALLDWMQSRGLAPGFELMGNPSQRFSNFLDDSQVRQWRQLVAELTTRYMGRYGAENVSRWRFEIWNEPDLRGYNTLNFTLPGYLHYFHASAEGLREAAQQRGWGGRLRLGGPAGLFKSRDKHPLCWGLLEHCGTTPCPLDFLSFHKKGGGSGAAILRQGVRLVRGIHARYPALRAVPIANDEADPLTGWSRSEPWRGDARYGALVAHVVARHQQVMVRRLGLTIEVLSNDNAFLNFHPYYFSQRTLLARFQMNNTKPPHLQFFRKPVYVTMALMSFLGETELNVSLRHWNDSRLAVLAASSSPGSGTPAAAWTAAVLLTFSADTEADPQTFANVTLVFRNAPAANGSSLLYTVWTLDNSRTNPDAVWRQAGAPVFPDRALRRRMRAAEGPFRLVPVQPWLAARPLRLPLTLPLPSVALLHVCAHAAAPPGQVMRLEAFKVTLGEVLLVWSDSLVMSRCIKTYEVEFSPMKTEGITTRAQFQRVNKMDVIFLSYQHVAPGGVRGLYRVRAVDYWGRPGRYSPELRYPA